MATKYSRTNSPEKRARIGERIKIACTQSGMSLKSLASKTGTTPTLIYQYVRGIISVPPELIEKIAAETRTSIDFFDPDKDVRPAAPAVPVGEQESTSDNGGQLKPIDPDIGAKIKYEMEHLKQLREAYIYPKRNKAAYVSTMEQMLALARTVENRKQEAWILWQLARIKIEENSLELARTQIMQAQKLFLDEGMVEYRNLASMDLAAAYELDGELEEARKCLEVLVDSPGHDLGWRVMINLGCIAFRMHDNTEALRCFCKAAEHIEHLDPAKREHEGMIFLLNTIADVARTTGHQEEAILLWTDVMQRSSDDRLPEHFLESIMGIATTLQEMGKLNEAKQRLELAVILAGFLFEDDARLSVARGLLADLLVTMGSIEDARDNARMAQRLAYKVRSAQPTIVSALSLAETSLAAGQWRDGLDYSQEALDEAKRTKRTREVSRARELRARAFLAGARERLQANDTTQAGDNLNRAFAEAASALDYAIRADTIKEILSARLTLAKCYMMRGDDQEAEEEACIALELSKSGAVGLQRLLGEDAVQLPGLLRHGVLDLASLFSGRGLSLPSLEWQAHFINGTLKSRRLGPEAGYESMKEAALLVRQVLLLLTPAEAARYIESNGEVTSILEDLNRFAISPAAKAEAQSLIEGIPYRINADVRKLGSRTTGISAKQSD